jgi:hypothetical protein
MFHIGFVRHMLRTRHASRWNSWMLDMTARLEGSWLIASRGGIGYKWVCRHTPTVHNEPKDF